MQAGLDITFQAGIRMPAVQVEGVVAIAAVDKMPRKIVTVKLFKISAHTFLLHYNSISGSLGKSTIVFLII